VEALRSLIKRFDVQAVRGDMPRIVRRAAVRTIILALVACFVMAAFAYGDPVGSNYGGPGAIVAESAGNPTLAEVAGGRRQGIGCGV
jgi:hypothetical protein